MKGKYVIVMGFFLLVCNIFARNSLSILVVGKGGGGINFLIDPVLEKKLGEKGYEVGSLYYENLTEEKLKLFNVLIMLQESVDEKEEILKFKKPILEFVKRGGGLLIFFDEHHYDLNRSYTLNSFLKELGAEVTRERFNENNPKNIHKFSLLAHGWPPVYKTTVVLPHPITEGIKEFWYPHFLGVMKLNSSWKILIKGEGTASFANTYKKYPPILAVRKYGKGRIALFMGHSSFYVNNGYHRAYEYGWCFEMGDGLKLFLNLFNWLGEPSLKSNIFGGYKKGMFPPLQPKGGFQIVKSNRIEKFVPFPGVIGVYTKYSGGKYSVEDFAKKAKDLGLKFIIFTDRIKNNKDWGLLKEECKRVSDKNFVAILGVEFEDNRGNKGYAGNINNWPLESGIGRTSFIHALLKAGKNGIYAIITPKNNSLPPWTIGGFNSLEILSYQGLQIFDGAMDWFKSLQATPGFNLLPIVSHRIWTLDDLERVCKKGFKLYLYASDISSLSSTWRKDWIFGFVSNGPVIENFWCENLVKDPWETYILWEPGDIIRLHIKVNSSAPLTEVKIFSGSKLIRTFKPRRKVFSKIIEYPISEDGSFYLEIKDIQGKWAISSPIPTRNLNYWNHVGSDRMNDYHNPILPDPYGTLIYNGKRYGFGGLVTFGYGWGNYLRFYHPVPQEAYHPQGYETGQISAGLGNLRTFPKVFSPQTKELDNPIIHRENPFASRDVAIMLEKVNEILVRNGNIQKTVYSKFLECNNKITIYKYKYRPYGYIILLIDSEVKVNSTLNLHKRKGLKISLLELQYRGWERFKHLSVVSPDGKLETRDLSLVNLKEPLLSKIGKGGYATLWPDPFGLVAIYSLDNNVDIEVGKGYMRVGYDIDGKKLLAGRVFKERFIVVEEGGGQGIEIWEKLRKLWGLSEGKALYEPEISFGTFESKGYIVDISTSNYGVWTKFPKVDFIPNEILPIRVKEINENWSAGAVDMEGSYYL